MKKTLFKIFLAIIVIPSLVVATIHWLDKKGFFNLDHVEIVVEHSDRDPQYLQPLVLELNAQLDKFRGQSLWHLDLSQISQQIQNLKWIEGNYLSRRWPTSLSVKITPKEVKMLYMAKGGDLFPLVGDGSFLNSVSIKSAPDVVLLEGPIFESSVEMRRKAVRMIDEIPHEGKFSEKKISEIRFDPREGFWATMIQSGIRVKIGEENIPIKAERVAQVLEYLESRQLEARVIDANLSKKVLVRLRKDP
jgi:cell division protein FtsQ